MYIHLGPYCKPAFGCIGYPSNKQINKQISALEHVIKLISCSCVLFVFINRICKHYYA